MKWVVIALLLALIVPAASAALIEGTVYDFSLKRVYGAIVTIDTSPEQRFVADNASYSFDVGAGAYTIRALKLENGRIVSEAGSQT